MRASNEIRAQAQVSPFDLIRQVDAQGREFWSARQLAEPPYLNYDAWRTMAQAIERAKLAAKNSGHDPGDHFVVVHKMVGIGSGAEREIEDVHLSRRACYLVALNGDPRKPEIAAAQAYFVEQTRWAELSQDPAGTAQAPDPSDPIGVALWASLANHLAIKEQGARLASHQAKLDAHQAGLEGLQREVREVQARVPVLRRTPPLGYFPLGDWAFDRGLLLTGPQRRREGSKAKKIAERLDQDPVRYQPTKEVTRNAYTVEVLEEWARARGHLYASPALDFGGDAPRGAGS